MKTEAFILVGGRSTRFGSDKGNVRLGGKSLIGRTAETIRRGIESTSIKLVAADTQWPRSSILPVVFDFYPDRGPFGAVHAALATAEADWAFIVACDFPCLSSDLIGHLSGLLSDDMDAVAPVQRDGRIQPLCAFYRVKPCLEFVEPLIEKEPAPPVRAIFEKVRTRLVTFNEISHLPGSENFFLNMNTPADHQKALSILDAP